MSGTKSDMKPGCLEPAIGLFALPLIGVHGYTWTLTSALGVFLHVLQERYGPRDMSFTPLGIEFGAHRPNVWYPGGRRYIAVMLSADAAHQPERALWQLAHEAVHLLAPTGGNHALWIEEGLASLFADEVSAEQGLGFRQTDTAYMEAATLVQRWLSLVPDAVKRTRQADPCFATWTPETIISACPSTPFELASQLCQPFST